jgi:hypothetical protein
MASATLSRTQSSKRGEIVADLARGSDYVADLLREIEAGNLDDQPEAARAETAVVRARAARDSKLAKHREALQAQTDCTSRPLVDLPGVTVRERPRLNVRDTTGRDDFESLPGALPMTIEDISNVAKLSRTEAKIMLRAVRALAPIAVDKALAKINETWGGWPEDDERWTLTPHELRRANELALKL